MTKLSLYHKQKTYTKNVPLITKYNAQLPTTLYTTTTTTITAATKSVLSFYVIIFSIYYESSIVLLLFACNLMKLFKLLIELQWKMNYLKQFKDSLFKEFNSIIIE